MGVPHEREGGRPSVRACEEANTPGRDEGPRAGRSRRDGPGHAGYGLAMSHPDPTAPIDDPAVFPDSAPDIEPVGEPATGPDDDD
jgi:hypothetical protein